MGRKDEALEILAEAELRDPEDELLQRIREGFFAPEPVEQ